MTSKIGKFELTKNIGSGASCKVKLGMDTTSGKIVAVKILNENMDSTMKTLVMNEINAMAEL